MSRKFQRKIALGIEQKYGQTIANSFLKYCKAENISDESLYYDLTKMTYKWSIIEVFLIDVLLLQNKQSKRIYEHMQKLASEEPEPIAVPTEPSKQKKHKKNKSKTDKTEMTKRDKSTASKHRKTPSIDVIESVTEISEINEDQAAEQCTDNETKEETKLNADNNEENDPEIESWKVGSKCEVYSKAATKWVEGTITEIYEDEEGEWLRVQYLGDKAKDVQRYSEFVRKIAHENEPKNDSDNGDNKEKTWKNLIFNVSMTSRFDNWKIFDYSTTNDVTLQSIEERLMIGKNGRHKFKMVKVGSFAYFKKDNPKGYQIAVRCGKNSIDDAYAILDELKMKLDTKLETVKNVEKFKYKVFLDKIVKEISK